MTQEQIDFMLRFIDMLYLGRLEEITARKQLFS